MAYYGHVKQLNTDLYFLALYEVYNIVIKILFYLFTFLGFAASEVYQDRLRVYINNSIKSLQFNESDSLSNIEELNDLLIDFQAERLKNGFQTLYPLTEMEKFILIVITSFILALNKLILF